MTEITRPKMLGMASVRDRELTRLRAMTASEQVAVMHSLWRQAWSLKAAGVRALHPDWPPENARTGLGFRLCTRRASPRIQ